MGTTTRKRLEAKKKGKSSGQIVGKPRKKLPEAEARKEWKRQRDEAVTGVNGCIGQLPFHANVVGHKVSIGFIVPIKLGGERFRVTGGGFLSLLLSHLLFFLQP